MVHPRRGQYYSANEHAAIDLMTALSPTCEFNIFAARARGMKIAASARLRTLLCGGEEGHSFLPQQKTGAQGSSRGQGGRLSHCIKGPLLGA